MENIPIAEPITKPLISTTQNDLIELTFCRQCNQIYRINRNKSFSAQYYRCNRCNKNLLFKSIISSCQIM